MLLNNLEFQHTYLKKIFNLINNEQLNYNWLITDCECYPLNNELHDMFSKRYLWLSGERLTEIINKEDIQFIWGVFSGFSKDINLEDILKEKLPIAEGYTGFGKNNKPQHRLSSIEIIAWDSSYTSFISEKFSIIF